MSSKQARVQSIASYLFYASGRSSRKALLLSWLAILGVTVLVALGVGLTSDTGEIDTTINGIEFLFGAWSFIPAIRRCHDLEWSGWVSLLLLVPLANLWLLFQLVFKEGYVWD